MVSRHRRAGFQSPYSALAFRKHRFGSEQRLQQNRSDGDVSTYVRDPGRKEAAGSSTDRPHRQTINGGQSHSGQTPWKAADVDDAEHHGLQNCWEQRRP